LHERNLCNRWNLRTKSYDRVTAAGVSEARGGPLIITYIVLLLAMLVFTLWASRWGLHRLVQRTAWSLWVSAPLAIVGAVAVGTAVLTIGFFGLVLLGVSYTAVELRTGVLAGAETPVLNQSEV
jgi:hypothetical protein